MADDRTTLAKLTKQFAQMKSAMDALEQQIKETQSKIVAKETTRKPRIWVPKDGDEYYYLNSAGQPVLTDEKDHDLVGHGNFFATPTQAEHAAFLHRSINVQLGFAYSNDGDGRQQAKSYCLGQEKALKANTLPYPTMVYFRDEPTAQACYRYLVRKKWLNYTGE